MSQPKYIVNKSTHRLHRINGCAYSKSYNAGNYREYYTLAEAYAEHGSELRPCKFCSMSNDLSDPRKFDMG